MFRLPAPTALLVLAPLVAGCWGSPTDVDVSRDTDRVSSRVVDEAIDVFRNVCRPLFTVHAADVRSIRAIVSDETATEPRRRGWGVHIDIEVTLRSTPTTLASAVTGEPARFLMGGGERPGLLAFSPTAAALCDRVPPADREQAFVQVPILGSLLPRLRLQPTEAQRRGWAEELARATSGDYQSQRNIAWCRYDGCDGVEPIDDVASCAWRMVIAAAKDPRSDGSDIENVDTYCRRALTAADQAAARIEAARLFRRIYRADLPK